MKICVLGAGITGVLSAYYLARSGHEVEVVDRAYGAAQETSFANGGQLSYSHAEPWANPGVFPKLFKWMFRDDAPLVLRFSSDPQMIKWGLQFLWNCRKSQADQNCVTMLRLGLFSRDKMAEIREDTGIDFEFNDKGILHVFNNEKEFEAAQKQAEFQEQFGCVENTLTWKECVEMEPALSHTTQTMYGGIHAPLDEYGDIHIFTTKLAKYCEDNWNVKFRYNTEILRLHEDNDAIRHVSTNTGNIAADVFVMALGSYSPLLLRKIGIRVPIYPMKGYSVTFPTSPEAPKMSVTDGGRKIVYSRLGDRVRVAGTAEFAGYNTDVRAKRIDPIVRGVEALFPEMDTSKHDLWACLRPSTPDGPPIIGKTIYRNLYLNTGHGTLGWTQGAGTSNLLASVINNETPEISMERMTIERYG